MALEDLPNGFFVPTRDEIRDQFQNDVRLYTPGAPIGDGSQAFADGSVVADTLAPVYGDAVSIARDADLDDMTLDGLKAEARGMGIPELLPASSGGGFVEIAASAGGVPIDAGRELYDEKTSLRFQCLTTGTYFDKQPVPIIGIDTGPTTNLPAGTVLKWRSPPPGLGAKATILADSNGDGFTGGRVEESQNELKERISSERAEPSAGGNVASVRRYVKEAGKRLGIAIQEVFVYPGIKGPGTTAYLFTLRAARAGGTRAPNAVQIAQVLAFITGALPEDDGLLACSILEVGVTSVLEIEWTASGWADLNPWPKRADDWYVSSVVDALSFGVKPTGGPLTLPQVGHSIAFFDETTSTFKLKRIGAVSGPALGEYTLTIDTTNNASDIAYVPTVNERFCPWADSLSLLFAPLATEFDKLGPGEQVEFFDAGYRQKRSPAAPWPYVMRHKMLDLVDDLPQIADVKWIAPDVPYVTPMGTEGVSSNLLMLERLLAFPP